jgi:hypothetical protein
VGFWATEFQVETTLTVLPAQAPTQLKASPDSLQFNVSKTTLPLRIIGVYSSGEIDLTTPEAGTTYATQSGQTKVVSVSAAGVVTAKSSGQDTIIASNSGKTVNIPVTVNITNHVPVISIQGGTNLTLSPPQSVTLTVKATDSDHNAVALSLLDAPAFASFTDLGNGNATIVLTPLPTDAGLHEFRVYALDNGSPALATTATIRVNVKIPKPTVTLSATPNTVPKHGSSTLSWSSTNATACNAAGGWTGSKPLSGSSTLNNLIVSRTYALTCTGSGGSTYRSVKVTVQ